MISNLLKLSLVSVMASASIAFADDAPPVAPTPDEAAQAQTEDPQNQKIVGMDEIDFKTACATAQDAYDRLSRLKKPSDGDPKDKAISMQCGNESAKAMKLLCDKDPAFCRDHVVGGVVVWLVGAEANVPWIRTQARVVLGISTVHTIEEGSHRYQTNHRIVTSLTANKLLGGMTKIISSLKNLTKRNGVQVSETETDSVRTEMKTTPEKSPDFGQIIMGGVTFILVPSAENSQVTMADIISRPKFPANRGIVWEDIKGLFRASLAGGEVEFLSPGQSDMNQKNAFEVGVNTNVNSAAGIWDKSAPSPVVMVNVLHSIGKIRTQTYSGQLSTIFDITGLFPDFQ